MQLQHSLTQPEVGGVMRFSRGIVYLNQGNAARGATGQATPESGAHRKADLVAQAFSALSAHTDASSDPSLLRQYSRLEGIPQVDIISIDSNNNDNSF